MGVIRTVTRAPIQSPPNPLPVPNILHLLTSLRLCDFAPIQQPADSAPPHKPSHRRRCPLFSIQSAGGGASTAPYNTPFVLGTPGMRGSVSTAMRAERATDLKIPSAM